MKVFTQASLLLCMSFSAIAEDQVATLSEHSSEQGVESKAIALAEQVKQEVDAKLVRFSSDLSQAMGESLLQLSRQLLSDMSQG